MRVMDAGQQGPLSELLGLELPELELLELDELLLDVDELLLPEDELLEELDEELPDERLLDDTERLPLCESFDELEGPLLRPLDSLSPERPLAESDPEDEFCD